MAKLARVADFTLLSPLTRNTLDSSLIPSSSCNFRFGHTNRWAFLRPFCGDKNNSDNLVFPGEKQSYGLFSKPLLTIHASRITLGTFLPSTAALLLLSSQSTTRDLHLSARVLQSTSSAGPRMPIPATRSDHPGIHNTSQPASQPAHCCRQYEAD